MTSRAGGRWAERLAREHLALLPRRVAHLEGVARRAGEAASVVADPELLIAAAWLHDIGYGPALVETGFHPLDGAHYLRRIGAAERLCGLVANHSSARIEARRRGIPIEWADEESAERDALWWADTTTTPTGHVTTVSARLAEVEARYGADHIVTLSVAEAAPSLLAAAERTEQRIRRVRGQVK
ncbi:HD domain-containing protein [Nocardia sp. NPDC058499]|uniref:HD domain-containing protein n=1 Tax=Nocardia sp. NPDC058499 TaxID=3346530 RepID=UPI0036608E83